LENSARLQEFLRDTTEKKDIGKIIFINKMNLGTDIFLKIFAYYEDILREQSRKKHELKFEHALYAIDHYYIHTFTLDVYHGIHLNVGSNRYPIVGYYKKPRDVIGICNIGKINRGKTFYS
jgi:hypothetical protein